MDCTCKEWLECIDELNGVIQFAYIHGMEYNAGYFKYCPWCGKKLEEEK